MAVRSWFLVSVFSALVLAENQSDWMRKCVGDYSEIPIENFLPSAWSSQQWPWRRYPAARLYRIPTVTQRMNVALQRRVQGTNLSAATILRRLEVSAFLWGGAVRDAVRGVSPTDLDFGHNGPTLKANCSDRIGRSRCHSPHPGSQKLTVGFVDSAKRADNERLPKELEPLDFAPWSDSFDVPPTKWEYTADALAYFDQHDVVLDLSGRGMRDACDGLIRIPTHKWDQWAEESSPTKVLRYWKLRAKGFQPSSQRLRSFIIRRARTLGRLEHLHEWRHFYCHSIREGRYENDKCLDAEAASDFVQKFRNLFADDVGAEFLENFTERNNKLDEIKQEKNREAQFD